MNPGGPLVTVVVPARDAADFVEAAVRSVLAQTWTRLECIVVDDGSADETADVVERIEDDRVVLVRQPTGGVAAARNRGIGDGRGDLVALLDADDVWLPGKLAAQIELLDRRPELGAVLCGYTIADEVLTPRLVIRPRRTELDMQAWLLGEGNGLLISSTGVARRGVIDAIGGFDESFSTSADLDFAARLRQHAKVGAVPESLVLYRSHPSQMHRDLEAYERDATRVIERHIEPPATAERGLANLHTRLLAYRIFRGEWRAAARHGRLAWRHDRTRLVALPLSVLARRARRRIDRHA